MKIATETESQPQTVGRAPLLVIEGIDGSGKGTQAKRLHERLSNDGLKAVLISFPQYEQNFFGQRVGDFLNGKFGQLGDLHPFLISLLYSGDRFESKQRILEAQKSADIVILDRYVPSNIAHQSAKVSGAERSQLREWIEHIEYEIFKVPRPSHVLLIDTPVEVSQELISRKSQRTYTAEKADLQEADIDYMRRVRQVYQELAHASSDWSLIEIVHEHGLRTVHDVAAEIYTSVQRFLPKSSVSQDE